MFSRVAVRSFHASSRVMQEAAAATPASGLVLNFCTPHTPIYTKKQIDKVMLPGEIGEYGITAGHSPLISQLKSGIVSIQHLDVSIHSSCLSFEYFSKQRFHRGKLRSFLCLGALLSLMLIL